MQIFSSELNAALAHPSIRPRYLIWFTMKDRSTGLPYQAGIWSGIDEISVSIDGVTKTYLGVGSILDAGTFEYDSGLNIRSHSVTLSMLDQTSIDFVRNLDPKLGKIDIHLLLVDEYEQPIGTIRVFRGIIDQINISSDQQSYTVEISCVSSLRNGTRTLPTKASDEGQKLRDATDKGRAYSSISGSVPVSWGQKSDLVPNYTAKVK